MARTARRQLLTDRFAEYLADHGAAPDHAAAYARDLLRIMDDLGFRLPEALDDGPPADARTASREVAESYLAQMRADLEARRRARGTTP